MNTSVQGTPCWYELTTPDLAGAQAFYSGLLGWSLADAGMADFTYMLAKSDTDMVAGMMAPPAEDMPTFWLLYFAVEDCDADAEAIAAAGGTVHKAPADIPGTGRFAIVADPQGGVFGLLQPLPPGDGHAFDQQKAGHGNWHELMTTDPKAAMAFYGTRFGWTPSSSMAMGELGSYDLFNHRGADIGGMMPMMNGAPRPYWLPYFGIEGIDGAVEKIAAAGGKVLNGPMEVPGGAWVVQAQDPQGAMFALVGPK